MKKIYAIMGVVFLLAVMAPMHQASGISLNGEMKVTGVWWYQQNSTEQVAPGNSYVPLVVSFTNAFGTVENLSVSVNLNNSTVFSYSHIHGSSSMITENISYSTAGQNLEIVQPLNISSTAKTGLYTLLLEYSFFVNTTRYHGNTSFVVPVLGTVNIVGAQAFFGYQSEPIIGTPGMKNIPLTVILENVGNSFAQNITVRYAPAFPLTGATQVTYVSAIRPFGFSPVSFIVSIPRSSNDGIFEQDLTVSFSGVSRNVSFFVPVTGYSNLSLVSYYTDPPVIYQGQKFIRLTAILVNSGNSFASDVTVNASSSSFSLIGSGYHIPLWPSGQIFNFTFLLNAPTTPGMHSVTLHYGSSATTIHLKIKSKGSISVTSHIPPAVPGQSKVLESFKLTNSGNQTLYDLTVYLVSPSMISVHVSSSNPLGALTAYNFTVGELRPGQSFTVTFLVDVSSSAPTGTFQSQLFITYHLNESLSRFTSAYNFNNVIEPTSIQKFENSLPFSIPEFIVFLVIIAVVITVVSMALRSRRKRRR